LIIPSGSTPGAREAGVTFFIDKALATFDRDKREAYRQGLRTVQARRQELFPGSTSIASLKPGDQLRLAEAIENTGFFETLRVHTVVAFLGRPNTAGNRDQAGWKLIGFKGVGWRGFRPSDTVDFVVIGSGAAGGVVAKETRHRGIQRRCSGARPVPA